MAKRAKSKKAQNQKIIIVAIVLVIAAAIVLGALIGAGVIEFSDIVAFFNRNEGEEGGGGLEVHFIDVGQGDAILIIFPDGKSMLIDAGNSSNNKERLDYLLNYLNEHLPAKKIDYLMLTHGDSDHCYYLDDVIAPQNSAYTDFDVDCFFVPNVRASHSSVSPDISSATLARFTDEDTLGTAVYAAFFNAVCLEEGAEIRLNIGVVTISGADYTLTFYCPTVEDWQQNRLNNAEAKNEISPIGVLEYKGRRIVLTGDAPEEAEERYVLRAESLDCDVLKAGHHGSKTSSSEEFLEFVDCEYAVISCGKNNSYNHPDAEVLDRYASLTMSVYRTDVSGTVVLTVSPSGSIDFSTEK